MLTLEVQEELKKIKGPFVESAILSSIKDNTNIKLAMNRKNVHLHYSLMTQNFYF